MDVTPAERKVLERLAAMGGRSTFRPDGESRVVRRAFAEGMAKVLLALSEKGLIRLSDQSTEVIDLPGGLPGQPGQIAAITAELTEAGREALR